MTANDIAPTPVSELLLGRRELIERIEWLAISADAKAVIADIAAVTVEIGGRLVEVGRRILSFVFDTAGRFPNTAFGLIIAFAVSSLIASIPLFGPILGPLLSPLLLALGLTVGALQDLRDNALKTRVALLEREFAVLREAR